MKIDVYDHDALDEICDELRDACHDALDEICDELRDAWWEYGQHPSPEISRLNELGVDWCQALHAAMYKAGTPPAGESFSASQIAVLAQSLADVTRAYAEFLGECD